MEFQRYFLQFSFLFATLLQIQIKELNWNLGVILHLVLNFVQPCYTQAARAQEHSVSKQQDMAGSLVQLTHSGDVHHCFAIIFPQFHHHTTATFLLISWEEDNPVSCLHGGLWDKLNMSERDPDVFILQNNTLWSNFPKNTTKTTTYHLHSHSRHTPVNQP